MPCKSAWLKLLEWVGLSTGCELGNGEGLLGATDLACGGTGLLAGGGIGIYNASELLCFHQWRQVAVVLGNHQNRCSHLLCQIVNGDAF